MKLLPDTAWFNALKSWRVRRKGGNDPGDMGTAFGLDSITVIDFDSTAAPSESAAAATDWHSRRVTRRSGL